MDGSLISRLQEALALKELLANLRGKDGMQFVNGTNCVPPNFIC